MAVLHLPPSTGSVVAGCYRAYASSTSSLLEMKLCTCGSRACFIPNYNSGWLLATYCGWWKKPSAWRKRSLQVRIHHLLWYVTDGCPSAVLPTPLNGLDSSLMSKYIEHVADQLLEQLGVPHQYGTPNPVRVLVNACFDEIHLPSMFPVSVLGHAACPRKIEFV